jgi:hypothetical protein
LKTRLAWAAAGPRVGGVVGLCLAACGGVGALDPGAGNDPGHGTGTLAVVAAVYALPHQGQAHTGADFDVSFLVRVTRNREPVTAGSVTVTSATGKVSLTFCFGPTGPVWAGFATGYDEVYLLDVVAGPDRLEGVRVDGPGIHAFSEPAEGASIDATARLDVAWDRDQPAELAAIRPEPGDWIAIDDSGSYSLPPGAFRAGGSTMRQHTLRLARTNRVSLASGDGDGDDPSFSVTVENDVHVIEPPLPL